ncbi:LOW QUALITY PROTEIN: calcium homeostasis modulator protein 6 [Dugong dugon]
MEKFQTVLSLYQKHHNAIGYGLMTFLTASGERVFSTVVFSCPCSATWNLPYGLVSLLVPALGLFFLGYMLSARTWRLFTSCCAPAGRTACCAGLHGAVVCTQLSAASALAPLTWVAVALLGGAFYECAARSAPFAQRLCRGRDPSCVAQLPLVPCKQANMSKVQDLLKDLRAESQVIGWILIAIVIIILLAFTSLMRCTSPVSYLQLEFWKIYMKQEENILKTQATAHATVLAKENVKSFFDGSHPKEYNTPSIKDRQQISSLYTFNPKDQYYSMLHKYVNRKEESHSITSAEGDVMVPVLDFVDSFDISTTAEL